MLAVIAAVAAVALVIGIVVAVLHFRADTTAQDAPDTEQRTEQRADQPDEDETEPEDEERDEDRDRNKDTNPAVPATIAIPDTITCSADGSGTSVSWHWSGSAFVSETAVCGDDNGREVFGVWTPVLPEPAVCDVMLLHDDERMDRQADVFATYGHDPTVFLAYEPTVKASGTTPEAEHFYVQEVDLASCSAKPRVEIPRSGNDDYSRFTYIGSSTTSVAFLYELSSYEDGNAAATYAVSAGDQAPTLLQDFSGAYEDDIEVADSGCEDLYTVELDGDGYRIYSIDDNEMAGSVADNYCRPDEDYGSCGQPRVMHLDGARYLLVEPGGVYYRDAAVLDVSDGSLAMFQDLTGLDGTSIRFRQLHDGSLFVQLDDRYFHATTQLAVTELLSADQWAELTDGSSGVVALNYMTGEICVQTTDENITVDMDGQSTGSYDHVPDSTSAIQNIDVTQIDRIAWEVGEMYAERWILTTGDEPDAADVAAVNGTGE